MQKDLGKYFGSAMMIGFGALALYRWYQTQVLFFLLLVLRDFTAGYFFFKRNSAIARGSQFLNILAYFSSAMPLLYFGPSTIAKSIFLFADLLSIAGFVIVVFATVELGTSIGISPANRGLVRTGIYQHIRHPMYLGYVISEMGLILLNSLNVVMFLVSTSLYIFRAKSEKRILEI
ncbi:MAG: hypothetical protein A4S09_15005 [Proteobacteria bacterium SG_bin7]|nr:MAG: hypothetical protein A4S09_15005 [Proteobacteria bacterium SG_bin7]